MAKQQSVEWLIRLASGRQLGPYPTSKVLKLIADGVLVGDEKVKHHPDGQWIAVSREPEFYDQLLQALEDSNKPRKIDPTESETVIIPIEPISIVKSSEDRETKSQAIPVEDSDSFQRIDNRSFGVTKTEVDSKTKTETKTLTNTITTTQADMTAVKMLDLSGETKLDLGEVEDPSASEKKRKKSSPFLLAVILAVCFILVYMALEEESGNEINRSEYQTNLLVPQATTADKISEKDADASLAVAGNYFATDTYEGYIESQNRAVSLIESAPRNAKARGFLCLVYKELWPFVKQDQKDIEAIQNMARAARTLDPTGVNSIYCEVVRYMISGKIREAKGVVDNALNQISLGVDPVLYNLKAELLAEDNDTKTAILYAEKANEYRSGWMKPILDVAKYEARLGQYMKSTAAYQKVLKIIPQHKKALIELGIVFSSKFQQMDSAYQYLSAGVASPSKVDGLTMALGYYELARIENSKRNSARALELAQKAFDLNPADSRFRDLVQQLGGSGSISKGANTNNELVFLGDQFVRTGDCLAAQAQFKTAYELDNKNAVAAYKAAKCMWQLNQTSDAVLWLDKAINADKNFISAYALQADYLSKKYNPVRAIQVLNRAVSLSPNNFEILRSFGLVEFRRGSLKEAQAYLLRAEKMFSNDLETLILLAKVYSAQADFQTAQKYAIKAIELDGTSNEAQIVYAKILVQFQGFDNGITYIKELVRKFSYTVEFRLAMADMYRENERLKEAQLIYTQIIDAEPRNKEAFIGLGLCYQGQAIFNNAIKSYQRAALVDPSDADPIFRVGKVYLELNQYKEAVKQFERAIKINENFPLVRYFIGRAYMYEGDLESALKWAMEERKLNPGLADSYILAAEYYTKTSQYQKCANEYQQATRLRPQGAELYVKMARCYRQAGSPDLAETMLNLASAQESGYADIYREQGAIFELQGDFRAAVVAYNKYLSLAPNAADRTEIESRITSLSSR